jgi:hypothetical protein
VSIAIDGSSPIRFSGTPNDNVDITSASFTPPNNSVLVVNVNADTADNATNITISVSGGSLTWTNRAERDPGDAGANAGHASIWTAVVATGASMTVSVRRTTSGGGTNRISVKVYVVTGADTSAPVGAVNEGSSGTNNLTAAAYNSTVNNSRGFGCATDWNELGTPTSTDTGDGADYSGQISVISAFKAADTPSSGTAVTLNFDAAGSSAAEWNWVAIEILPAAGGGGTVNADARFLAGSRLSGFSAVVRVSAARASAGSRHSGQTAVARVSSARCSQGSAARGMSAVARISQAVFTARSTLRAAIGAGQVLADARFIFRATLSGLARVAQVGAARLFARSGLSARYFQDTIPTSARITVSVVTRAKITSTLATRAQTSDSLATRAKITVSSGG